jgi:hypothetical protein
METFDIERFSLKKLEDRKDKDQYGVKISYRFTHSSLTAQMLMYILIVLGKLLERI